MKRRQMMVYAGAGLLTMATTFSSKKANSAQDQGSLLVQWLGHTCFLFTTGGTRILANPFRTIGCTAKYRSPKVEAGLVIISSQLLDEGAVEELPNDPRLIYEPGIYEFDGIQFQGIATDHDRFARKRFGTNVAWRWTQGGINILHLGGVAAPITLEQKILMGRPDLLLVPVGGGPKAYSPQEAKQAVQFLNPKLVIPTQYRTQAADPQSCDIVSVDEFLALMPDTPVRRDDSDTITIGPNTLPKEGVAIQLLSYQFL